LTTAGGFATLRENFSANGVIALKAMYLDCAAGISGSRFKSGGTLGVT